MANRQLFLNTDFQGSKGSVTLSCYGKLVLFSGSQFKEYGLKVIKEAKLDIEQQKKVSLRPYWDYPLVTYNSRILLEDSLFLNPSRVYYNLIISLRDLNGDSLIEEK
jgi:hypothetical protein